jgi:hypothetical protein
MRIGSYRDGIATGLLGPVESRSVMRVFGRMLQHLGLLMAPLAILLQMTNGLPKGWHELAMLGAAVCVFCLGRMIEGYAG